MNGDLTVKIGSTTLADGDATSLGVCETFSPAGTRAIETSDKINAAAPAFFDRSTVSQKLSLEIFRIFATKRAAIEFAFQQGRTLAGVADLTLFLVDDDGTNWQCVFPGCAWRTVAPEVRGLSVTTKFEVELAAAPTITNP